MVYCTQHNQVACNEYFWIIISKSAPSVWPAVLETHYIVYLALEQTCGHPKHLLGASAVVVTADTSLQSCFRVLHRQASFFILILHKKKLRWNEAKWSVLPARSRTSTLNPIILALGVRHWTPYVLTTTKITTIHLLDDIVIFCMI